MDGLRWFQGVVFVTIATLSACANPSSGTSVPALPNVVTGGGGDGGALVLRVKVPLAHRRGMGANYVSTSTQAMKLQITGPTNVPEKIAGLTFSSKGCAGTLVTVSCSLRVPGLAPCPAAGNCYLASITTYDAYDAKTDTIPAYAKVLSAAQKVPFRITAGTNSPIAIVLDGIPVSVAVIPVLTNTELSGNQSHGYTEPKCNSISEWLGVFGVDADGGYILGAGAPAVSLKSDDPAQLAVSTPKPPYTSTAFIVTPPTSPAYPVGNKVIHLTAKAVPPAQSGSPPVTVIVKYSYSGDICGVFTEFAIPTTGSQPRGIAKGPDGAMWFTEDYGDKIGRVTTTGQVTEHGGLTAGSGPTGIAAGPDGNLWFTESSAGKIGKITTAGSLTELQLANGAAGPSGIAAGPDSALWFTEIGASKIGRVPTNATSASQISEHPTPTAASDPEGIVLGPDHRLWFTECQTSNVGAISTSGAIHEYAATPTGTYLLAGIAPAPDGSMWFSADAGSFVGRITTAGVATSTYALGKYAEPYAMVAGPDGAMWFVEYGADKIGRVSLSGAIQEYAVPKYGAQPIYIALGPDGALWFTEYGGNAIGRLR